MRSDRLLLYAILTGGRDIKRKERQEINAVLGISESMSYRYTNRIGRAIFTVGEKNFIEVQKKLQKIFVD